MLTPGDYPFSEIGGDYGSHYNYGSHYDHGRHYDHGHDLVAHFYAEVATIQPYPRIVVHVDIQGRIVQQLADSFCSGGY